MPDQDLQELQQSEQAFGEGEQDRELHGEEFPQEEPQPRSEAEAEEDWVQLSPHEESTSRSDQPLPLVDPVDDRRFSRREGPFGREEPRHEMPPRDMPDHEMPPPREMPPQELHRDMPPQELHREEPPREPLSEPRRPPGPQIRAIHEEPMPLERPQERVFEREPMPLWEVSLM